jgi:hypothetical protein
MTQTSTAAADALEGNEGGAARKRDGSDGTRTRDLRRDRPVRGLRRLPPMDAGSLHSCSFSSFSRFASAWLSEADFRRLLPVCCPGVRLK